MARVCQEHGGPCPNRRPVSLNESSCKLLDGALPGWRVLQSPHSLHYALLPGVLVCVPGVLPGNLARLK